MKICVALLLATVVLSDGYVAHNQRQAKMPAWRTQVREKEGQGFFTVRGTAGGEASSTHSQPPSGAQIRPTGADCIQAGFYPTPGSCLHFYRCVDWAGDGSHYSAFHFTCSVGTVFDDVLDTCNYPYATRRPECASGIFEGSSDGSQPEPSDISQAGPPLGPSTGSQPGSSEGSPPQEGSSVSVEESSSPVSPVWSSTQGMPDRPGDRPTVSVTPEQVISSSEVPIISSTEASTQKASPGVFSLTCYTDNKYRRHPLYCNQYYYCINDGVWSVPIFTCPRDLVFDEDNQICARGGAGDLIASCDFAPYSTPRPVTTPSSEASPTDDPDTTVTVTDPPTDLTTQKTWELDPTSLFDCPAPGYYPFEGDCIRFYKCVETDLLQLKGLLYRCPSGYGYSEMKQRCLKEKDLPTCQRVPQDAHIRVDSATPLYPDDLVWFFKN